MIGSPLDGIDLDRSTPTAAYHQFHMGIRRLIQSGRLRPGQRLPTVSEMCQAHQLSRTTVQRAIGELSREGFLTCRRGSGCYVAETTIGTLEMILHESAPSVDSYFLRRSRGIYFGYMMESFRAALHHEEVRLQVSFVDGPAPSQSEVLARATMLRTNGFVLYRPHSDLAATMAPVSERFATVSLFHELPNSRADAVVPDARPALRRVLRERLAAGRRSFLFVTNMGAVDYPDRRVSPYQQMRDVYREVLREAGLDAPELVLPPVEPTPETVAFLDQRLRTLPEGSVVVSTTFDLPALPGKDLDRIGYTESPATLEVFHSNYTILYIELRIVADLAARLMQERRSEMLALPARCERIVPELIERGAGNVNPRAPGKVE